MIAELAKKYPKAITPSNPVPLAIGIHKQVDPKFPLSKVRKAIRRYTSKQKYIVALTRPGAIRYNLDGSIAGPVSGDHQMKAMATLEKRQKPSSKPTIASSGRKILTLKGSL